MTPSPTRAVLDSNVWVSAFISPRGNSAEIMRAVIVRQVRGVISAPIIAEIDRGLSKSFFRDNYAVTSLKIRQFLTIIQEACAIVTPLKVAYPMRDSKDLPIIGTALAGRATHLITGDRDFLEDEKLKEWMKERGVLIITARKYYELSMTIP